ncbi:MAG: hypothetical protein PHE36_07530 [Novosphingobium sp.]|nr:hypothetical protein [Novosphingobium sp.]
MIEGPEALCRSYDRAMLDKDGRAIAGHYLFPYTSFTLGQVHTFADRATADAACTDQIACFERTGVGSDIRMTGCEVVPVSPDSALCHVTWAVFPANGAPGWEWTNIYGYRRRGDEEGFEFNISDNEIAELLRRFPDFYSL